MDSPLEFVLLLLLAPMAAMTGMFLVQTFAATTSDRRNKPPPGPRPSVAVLVPAHNESAGITQTLRSIHAQLGRDDRIVVVADNCTDATAATALACGAEVFIRTNAEQRGKGYALGSGMHLLDTAPPQVVIIIDADCEIAAGAIDALAQRAWMTGRPVQARYLMLARPDTGATARIAAFAWMIRNCVRPLGLFRLGLPCQLMGAGMAIPWSLISTACLANGSLVEDIVLGLELAGRGAAPEFCPDALVTSFFPASRQGLKSQRYRWEHGHLGVMLGLVPRSLFRAFRRRDVHLAVLAFDLLIPPLALLMLALGATFIVALAMAALSGPAWPLLASSMLLAALATAIFISWWKFGRECVGLWDLCLSLGYVVWKIPLYFHFFVRRQVQWIRSERG
ncbi:glycosyltransferase family 2 protein [Massilia sp. YIM B02763]|uniref:glycosyltransferase family 2 protein n=1 Tax=Massilia sp. YIM B02763 TaxID=3050130 RepID=UPI0025B7309C|nr:glycosyltransferase family 2 protein [Massilia sp. YIM B02763]MDN4055658.1 glycosyltransferase family 2 protein [Massilia sp. YIM B02763]